MIMPNWNLLPFRPRALGLYITCALGLVGGDASAEEVQFNTDVLDVKDRENIDLGQFSRGGYIMPGNYMMLVRINKQELPEQSVLFYPAEHDAKDSAACISPAMVEQFGLKPDMKEKLTWWHQGECLTLDSLPGTSARADLGSASLTVSLPQAYLEYAADNWDPPSRWDEGVPGLLLDYYVNAQTQRQQQRGQQSYNVSGNGTVGANLSSWRLRADWQTR
ncbi:TPA: FimD/PapC N-terminal domain-containing protein, partial [Serratia fonticola]